MTDPLAARSLLFAPGDSERKLAKAGASEADLVLLDLEDAVAEANKPAARALGRSSAVYADELVKKDAGGWIIRPNGTA